MTKDQVRRADELLHAIDEITQMMTARDPESPLVKEWTESKQEYHREDGAKLPTAPVMRISIEDAKTARGAYDEEPQSITYWYLPRDVVERALRIELDRIRAELSLMGVETNADKTGE